MRPARSLTLAFTLCLLGAAACKKEPPVAARAETHGAETPAPMVTGEPTTSAPGSAAIGKEAPDFTLHDLDGNSIRLSQYRGKIVVLEWFNPGCPFVRASHTKGSLKGTAARHTKNGVVWVAVNSAATGKQGAGADANREAAKRFGIDHPILLDETGAVGKAYGATNTPHMFVVDSKGTLVYKGAIDNSPDGEGESAPDGKLVSYVDEAIAALSAGRPVATAETKAYGCGVKYAAH
jgi:peroxiredoxin